MRDSGGSRCGSLEKVERLQLVAFGLYFVNALSYLVFRCVIAFGGRLRESGNDTLVQAFGFSCQILIFSHKLSEFVSARRKASSEF